MPGTASLQQWKTDDRLEAISVFHWEKMCIRDRQWPIEEGMELIISEKDKKWGGFNDTFKFER